MSEKYCPRCQQTKPVSEFGKNKSCKDGLQVYCKSCKNSYQIKRKQVPIFLEKQCIVCKQLLPPSAFKKNIANQDNLHDTCNTCRINNEKTKQRAYRKQYYKKYPEKKKEEKKKYKKQHQEAFKEYSKNYYYSHIDEIKKSRQLQAQELKEYRRQYKQKNRDIIKQQKQQYRARKHNAPGSFTESQFAQIKALFNYTCPMCKKSEPEITLTRDHVIPLKKHGTNYIENIQPLCAACNSKKGTAHIDFRKKGFLKQLFPQLPLL